MCTDSVGDLKAPEKKMLLTFDSSASRIGLISCGQQSPSLAGFDIGNLSFDASTSLGMPLHNHNSNSGRFKKILTH